MIEYRLGDVLSDRVRLADDHYVYVVRDGATVLYVGRSRNPGARLNHHCYYKISSLGRAIKECAPASDDWTYTLYHLSDCIEAIERTCHPEDLKYYKLNMHEHRFKWSCVKHAEEALIITLRPELNVMLADAQPYSEVANQEPVRLVARPLKRTQRKP